MMAETATPFWIPLDSDKDEYKNIRMKSVKTEERVKGGLEQKVKQNERDEELRRIRMKGMRMKTD